MTNFQSCFRPLRDPQRLRVPPGRRRVLRTSRDSHGNADDGVQGEDLSGRVCQGSYRPSRQLQVLLLSNPPGNMQTLYNYMKEQRSQRHPTWSRTVTTVRTRGSVRRGAGCTTVPQTSSFRTRTARTGARLPPTRRPQRVNGDDRHDVAPPLADQVCVVHLSGTRTTRTPNFWR